MNLRHDIDWSGVCVSWAVSASDVAKLCRRFVHWDVDAETVYMQR